MLALLVEIEQRFARLLERVAREGGPEYAAALEEGRDALEDWRELVDAELAAVPLGPAV
jgi:hypothetical protein